MALLPRSLHAALFQTTQASAEKSPKASSVVYVNRRYGFRFSLPASWKGYSILGGEWRGGIPATNETTERGPEITIRHPLWTEDHPRQDIPIMVFTLRQWALIRQDKLIMSAAPFGPGEIGRNSKYVFALPPRFDYAFPTGYEEVEKIVQSKPLHPF
ncbi:hypothetical protein [Edaphobacter bradus]|uniref:hypothetical protein n=1 Tax=Edaphobacter bradus TaxID=2259016 RepID=UPI0021E058B0|nr:hypothetical protein [Edaphobacter bradus]